MQQSVSNDERNYAFLAELYSRVGAYTTECKLNFLERQVGSHSFAPDVPGGEVNDETKVACLEYMLLIDEGRRNEFFC